MATDLYAKCPCGSGKKIKFCCKDIISDIERIERMLQGEQRTSALDKINKLLEKHVDRPALLSLKALVLLELEQNSQADEVVERLLEIEPHNSSALALKAERLAREGDLPGGLRELHGALRFSEGVLSRIVYRSYLSVCVVLIESGEFISGYAHLLTLVAITKGQDRASAGLLVNVTNSERLPAIFQGLMIRDDAPEGVTWQREFDVAIDLYRNGDWSEAARMLDDMSARILDEPVLLRNQALLQAWTCNDAAAVRAFRDFAAIRDVDLMDAVEAEACAQMLEPADTADFCNVVSITHEIDSADATMEKLLSAPELESIPVQRDADSEGPPAKAKFLLMDRPIPEGNVAASDLSASDLPQHRASLALYGKQTDQEARIVVEALQNDHLNATLAKLSELIEKPLSSDNAVVHGMAHKVEQLFRPNYWVPGKTSLAAFEELQRAQITRQLSEVWPDLPLSQFGGKSAREAAAEKKMQRKVLAAILNLEFWADRHQVDIDFDSLRVELGLPAKPSIDPNDSNLRRLSPAKLRCVELSKLTDEDLKFVFEIVSVRQSGTFLYRIGEEVLQRPSMVEHLDLVEVHSHMADLAPSTDQRLDHLAAARDLSVSRGDSPATWLVAELDVRFSRAEVDQARRLALEIQSRYMKEPGVPQLLAQVVSKYGLLPDSAGPGATQMASEAMEAEPAVAAASTTSPSAVWTPGGDESASASEPQAGEKSKLWVPGTD